jgi:hypothetical protein
MELVWRLAQYGNWFVRPASQVSGMTERPSLQQILERVEAVWNDARGANAMPRRIDIDAVKMRRVLPYVALIDVVPGAKVDFRYRLLGQQMISGFGSNITGGLHSQHADRTSKAWPFYEAYKRCIVTGQAQDIDHEFRNHNGTLVRMRARVWPLSDDGATVTGLLGGGMFLAPELH